MMKLKRRYTAVVATQPAAPTSLHDQQLLDPPTPPDDGIGATSAASARHRRHRYEPRES